MRGRTLAAAALSMLSGITFAQSASADERYPRSSSGSARFKPYVDKAGLHHGHSGDKLARKVLTGTVGLRHARGPYSAWAMTAKPGKAKRRG